MPKIKPWMIILIIAIFAAFIFLKGCSPSCGSTVSKVPETATYEFAINGHTYFFDHISVSDQVVTLSDVYLLVSNSWKIQTNPVMIVLNPGDTFAIQRLR